MLDKILLDRGISIAMTERPNRGDMYSIEEAIAYLKVTRIQLYSYLEVLNMQRYKLPKDRKTYVHKSDIETIKQRLDLLQQ